MKRKIETDTIVRTGLLVVALINQGLTIAGKNPLPFSESSVGAAITYVLTAGSALWAWWKNNSFTQAALTADEKLEELKGE